MVLQYPEYAKRQGFFPPIGCMYGIPLINDLSILYYYPAPFMAQGISRKAIHRNCTFEQIIQTAARVSGPIPRGKKRDAEDG
jgi:hypothetical protein